jgi:D-glycero-D-manno-heptose 1,7-bisphosphate phosphatase
MHAAPDPTAPPPAILFLAQNEDAEDRRAWLCFQIRELSRFGIDTVWILGEGAEAVDLDAIRRRLPKPVRLITGKREMLAREPKEWGKGSAAVLAASAEEVVVANFARFLYESGPLPRRLVLETEAGARPNRFMLLPGEALSRGGPDLAPDALAPFTTRGLGLTRPRRPDLARLSERPALFFDRDGVINADLGYVGSRERFQWVAGAREALREAAERGFHVFVVTNQSGIGRGLYDERALQALHAWMIGEIRRAGGTVDDWRFCPHHPEAALPAYRRVCACRKPAPGMIRDLMTRWGIAPERALLIGDQETDLAAARAAGIRGIRFPGGDLAAFLAPYLAALEAEWRASLASAPL